MSLTVDKEGRRPVDPAANASGKIGSDARFVVFSLQRFEELSRGKAQLPGKRLEQGKAEAALVLQKQIVHFPELSACACKLSSFGCPFSMRMDLAQREVAEYKSKALSEVPLQPLDNGISVRAMRTFVIPIFHQGIFRMLITLNVILGSNRNFQCAHGHSCFGSFSSASRMPSAPGFTAIGEQ